MKIGIIGTGAYAIAIASLLENKNHDITMWTKLEDEYNELVTNHTNSKMIDYKLDSNIKFTMKLKDLAKDKDVIIIAIPAKFVKNVIMNIKPYYKDSHILIATKGIIEENKSLIHEFLAQELNTDKIACISGPSFAKEIIKKEPLGLTIASKNTESLNVFNTLFKEVNYLTIQCISDIIGCQLCGMFKNIFAIISGILDGMKVTNSTNAKFLTDASLEIKKIIHAFDGDDNTFNTYAGIGDFILTCTSIESRNYTLGRLIGENKDFETYKMNTTIEGLENLDTIYVILKEMCIESKLINILYEILYLSKPKESIMEYLKKSE